ncbi:hypothetical protein GKD14_11825 [Paeniclostridium sordellii]|nr:hypothetical protein [Paeniclostridium sordellii]MSB59631.1 hypothetical protein [Paeniclostridium sordellii]
MSLTSYLTNKKDEDSIRFQAIIKEVAPKKIDFKSLQSNYSAFDTKRELKAPYNLSEAQDARLVGTAFDYLARFRIAQVVKNNNHEVLEDIIADNFFDRFKLKLPKKILNQLNNKYIDAKSNIKHAIENDIKFNDSIIDDVYMLTILEQCWRGSTLPKDLKNIFNEPSKLVREDLKCLMKLFEENFIKKVVKPNSIVKYNPKFGACSLAIGGADADVYIDGTLYDYKCTKELGYRGKDAQQIIAYYILDVISKKQNNIRRKPSLEGYDINRIAIYSARVGEIYYVDIDSIDKIKLESAILKVDSILFNNRDIGKYKEEINLKTSNLHNYKEKSFIKILIVLLMILILFIGMINFSLKNEHDSKLNIINNIKQKNNEEESTILGEENNSNDLIVGNDIRENYNLKRVQAQELLPKGQGFFRYYNALISTLRNYDINSVNNAKVVYELSDQLLNDMYNEFKSNLGEEDFNNLRDEQRIWVNNKMKIENEMKDNMLGTYQKLIKMTLDRCEEWTYFYK